MFRRIRVVFSKHKPAPGERSYSTVALGALEQLIRLADKAQIPLVGGGFGIIKELIDISHVSCDSLRPSRAQMHDAHF